MRSTSVFVAVEGIDASGKTTLTATLAESLRRARLSVATHKEPGRGPVGMLFRRLSAKGGSPAMTMALLSAADRYQQQDQLAESRRRHQVVLVDRYYLSGLAYHAVDGIEPTFYRTLNQHVVKPDAYLYLDVSPALAAGRRGGLPDGYWEERDFAARLPAAYEDSLALVAAREAATIIRIDASQSAHDVLDESLAALSDLRPDLLEGRHR